MLTKFLIFFFAFWKGGNSAGQIEDYFASPSEELTFDALSNNIEEEAEPMGREDDSDRYEDQLDMPEEDEEGQEVIDQDVLTEEDEASDNDNNFSKADEVAMLEEMTNKELQDLLREQGLPDDGEKSELIDHLLCGEALESTDSQSLQLDPEAFDPEDYDLSDYPDLLPQLDTSEPMDLEL